MKHEDQNIEYKQSWREEYLKWICGFANADGGRMLIGVKDDKDGNEISVSDDKIYIANVGSLPDDWTVKRLLGKHSSRPRNPTIAGCVYLTGMIETLGRGIRKVFDECKRHGCPPPMYEVSAGDPGDIMVRIDAAPDAVVESVEPQEAKTIGAKVEGRVGAESGQSRGRVEAGSVTIRERIIAALQSGELSKAGIAEAVGLKCVSGHLNRTVRALLDDGVISATLKDKPASRLQKYRLVRNDMERGVSTK